MLNNNEFRNPRKHSHRNAKIPKMLRAASNALTYKLGTKSIDKRYNRHSNASRCRATPEALRLISESGSKTALERIGRSKI